MAKNSTSARRRHNQRTTTSHVPLGRPSHAHCPPRHSTAAGLEDPPDVLRDASADDDDQTHVLNGQPLPEAFHTLADHAVFASPVDPFDPMDKAFQALGTWRALNTCTPAGNLVREYPLSDKLLALSRVWRSPDRNRYVVAAKGAPEAIADLCHLGAEVFATLNARVEAATAAGPLPSTSKLTWTQRHRIRA